MTQEDIIKEYFINNPNRDIKHPEVVDWVTAEYKKRTGKVLRDPDRAIRKMAQNGFLIKIAKGVYKYDPDFVFERELEDFTEEQKAIIKERDGYKCVICGLGPKDGVEIQVDHIKPKDLGGKAEIENGQTLCAKHNFRKKNYSQFEMGKKFFITTYKKAKSIDDVNVMEFCSEILKIYDKYDIDSHIDWEK
ncbi:MAG: HNH endonuclease [Clostridia bacterium]|nr:HNH endonuclease [Clostridia bacterium]